jgi:hypothetical protein
MVPAVVAHIACDFVGADDSKFLRSASAAQAKSWQAAPGFAMVAGQHNAWPDGCWKEIEDVSADVSHIW